ncbi:hypothetical protein [Verminephrobacter aporrectodeae]|uniref:hypothetical protein n=1 Tax=Verminephrobacter aporrectodeae TaxID=1110389 RepID=UPI00111055F9|nr:hypothetical protein [Verminephrobacter aporrectodeae]
MVIQTTTNIKVEGWKFANDYKYVDVKGGAFAVSVMRGEPSGDPVVLIHALRVQFHITTDNMQDQPVSHPVNCALATLEMTEADARRLHETLGGLLSGSSAK